jgi:hypothetical protein
MSFNTLIVASTVLYLCSVLVTAPMIIQGQHGNGADDESTLVGMRQVLTELCSFDKLGIGLMPI